MCDKKDSRVLTLKYLLATAFFSGLPTSRSIWNEIERLLIDLAESYGSDFLETIVIESTFNHKLFHKYPRNCIYSNKVKEWLNEIWCKNKWVSKHIRDTETLGVPESEIGYKTYFLDYDQHYITLLESFEGITRGTTGLSSWGASKALSSWCSENPDVINKRNVIELGAGVGYTAAFILSSLHPQSYTATDYHPMVLSMLQHNLSLLCDSTLETHEDLVKFCQSMTSKMEGEELSPGEFSLWGEGNGPMNAGAEAIVKQLDWRRPLPPSLPFYDVIIAADVVYALHLLPDLVHIIRVHL